MLSIDAKSSEKSLYRYLSGAVGPRPIAFASTLDEEGRPNLSPFSFFNVFSANPPILVFSPVRRGSDGSAKHTFLNAKATKEVVINIVDYKMVQQMSLSSTDYAQGINEFEKAGLSMLKSDTVKPYRVAESPVQFECRINQIMELGQEGGAGNLIICEVLKLHIEEEILDEEGYINPYKIDQVARMGGNWYTRAKTGMFEVPKPLNSLGMGIDQLPQEIKNSKLLSGNDLGKLGNIEDLPSSDAVLSFLKENPKLAEKAKNNTEKYKAAKQLLHEDKSEEALKLLLAK